MYSIDLTGTVALITGGTRGIGLATAKSLARAGAQCVMTYKWGSADLEAIADEFEAMGAVPPRFEVADVGYEEDTTTLIEGLNDEFGGVDIFVSNVAFAAKTPTLDDYRKRSLMTSLDYSAWPLVDYVETIGEVCGQYPAYVVAISSDGVDRCYPGYDFVAASKSVLEVLTRYLGHHLGKEGCRVNGVRFGMVKTESLEAIFGEEVWTFLEQEGMGEEALLSASDCGKAVLALCSGLLDAMQSEIITVDRAMAFEDNLMQRYQRWMDKRSTTQESDDE